MSERLTANSLRERAVVTSLTTKEVEVYEETITAASDRGATETTLECIRKVSHWSQSDPHMKQVSAHFTRQGFVCTFHPGSAMKDQRDDDHLATVTVNWAEPSSGYRGVDEK